jgi:CheY-like chemotaxis protein
MKRALQRAKLQLPFHVAQNGEEAISYLSGESIYADRATYPIPQFVFLDLKMPLMDGFEVLEWIRDQPALAQLKVIVLSSSPEERDRDRALRLGAQRYVIKPPTPEMLQEIMQSVPECRQEPRPAEKLEA